MEQYNNPVPVAVGIIELVNEKTGDTFLLGVRRNIEPQIGGIAFPGGYLNAGETAEAAMARELEEETGLHIPAEHWIVAGTEVTPTNRLLIMLAAEYALPLEALELFVKNDEVQELVAIDANTPICFPLHAQWAEHYFAGQDACGHSCDCGADDGSH